MNIIIRDSNYADLPVILSLVKELASFQNEPEKVINTLEQMEADKALFHCLIAENEEQEVVGIALYFFAYYSWFGKSLYLDDLYVKVAYRGYKTGTMLLNRLFEIAVAENCKKVRWQVSDWNIKAIDFYEKCGAHIDREIYNCDFDQTAIDNFLSIQ